MTTLKDFEIGNLTVRCSIEFSLTPVVPATRMDPAEGGEVEDERLSIEEVLDKNGNVLTLKESRVKMLEKFLTDKYAEEITEACYKYAESNPESYYEDYQGEW